MKPWGQPFKGGKGARAVGYTKSPEKLEVRRNRTPHSNKGGELLAHRVGVEMYGKSQRILEMNLEKKI